MAAICATSNADIVTRRWGAAAVPKAASGKGAKKDSGEQQAQQAGKGVQVISCKGGQCVLRFDLSDLPKGAKIVRADLVIGRTAEPEGDKDEAMVDTEIYPQFSEFKDGDEGKTSRSPLAIRGPWFDTVDATEAVSKWADGKANGGFFVKSCAFLNPGGNVS